ncbi:MAG: SprB repeat-containing protein, partial [Bacteroidia bacterium]|nr:SprB repeat-containing protein [Bacteroidia bacterium]
LFPGAIPSVADGLHVSDIKFPGPGTYTVSLIVNACKLDTIKKSVVIPATVGMNATTSYVNASCPGSNTGSATIIETGGTATYAYSWLPFGGTAATANNLTAGTYTCIAKDALGCHDTSTVTVYQPAPLIVNMTIENITCSKGNGGVASINVSGGTPKYLYSWNTGGTAGAYANLAAGAYTVTVTDAQGCTASTIFNITSTSPANASFTQSPSGTVCAGTTVNFTNTGTTGTYYWGISFPNSGTVVTGTTVNFSYTFLSPGNYSITHQVTTNGCTNPVQSTVVVINCTGPKVTAIGNVVCQGSCAAITSSGTAGSPPYIYSWSNGSTTQNINVCPVSTATYTVTIKDSGGNTSTSTAMVTVNSAVAATVTSNNIICNGGKGSAAASGGNGSSPYAYTWSNGQTSQTATGLSAGNYTVTVTDIKGCTGISTVVILSPPPLSGQFTKGAANCSSCGCKEWLMVNAAGGTSPYSYSWPDGYANRYKNQLCPGNYIINIKDKNGCSINVSLTTP